MPDSPEYLARIRELAAANDPIAAQTHAPALLAELIANIRGEQLTTRPGPQKWSIGEILAHLAEDEIATAWRYRQMVEHSGISLAGFDQDLWAQLGDYPARDPHESLALFQLLRQANLLFLSKLTSEQWDRFGIHAERGRITVRELAAHMAGHEPITSSRSATSCADPGARTSKSVNPRIPCFSRKPLKQKVKYCAWICRYLTGPGAQWSCNDKWTARRKPLNRQDESAPVSLCGRIICG